MKAWMSSNFGKFATELRPLIDVRIWFLLNILKTNRPIKTKFCIHIIIDKIYVGIVNHCFFLCFVLYLAKISGERLQDHWYSGCVLCFLEVYIFAATHQKVFILGP